MLAYRAYLNIPTHIADTICYWLETHRLAYDHRSYQRAATCQAQTLLVLRWLTDATPVHRLARDSGISQATAYRYLHEALTIISSRAPSLHNVLAAQQAAGEMILCIDGTLIYTDAVATETITASYTNDGSVYYETVGWFSGKHRHFGGNLQVLSNRHGRPLYIAPVEPGATHDITAAREHIFDAVWATSLWVFADKGYQGAGPRIKTPPKGDRFNPEDETIRDIITGIRAPQKAGTRR